MHFPATHWISLSTNTNYWHIKMLGAHPNKYIQLIRSKLGSSNCYYISLAALHLKNHPSPSIHSGWEWPTVCCPPKPSGNFAQPQNCLQASGNWRVLNGKRSSCRCVGLMRLYLERYFVPAKDHPLPMDASKIASLYSSTEVYWQLPNLESRTKTQFIYTNNWGA